MDKKDVCNHVHRVPIAVEVGRAVVGGVSVGRCTRDALPGMVVCYEHATRDAMAMHINNLHAKLVALGKGA